MSPFHESPVPYRVAYSERVRSELKKLLTRAAARGFGRSAFRAGKEINTRLHIYPQFGEPLRDLATPGRTEWLGTVPPLVVQYIIDEVNHLVFVVRPFRLLPHSKISE